MQFCLCPQDECSEEEKVCEIVENDDRLEQEVCECKQEDCNKGEERVCSEMVGENGESTSICKCVEEQSKIKKKTPKS